MRRIQLARQFTTSVLGARAIATPLRDPLRPWASCSGQCPYGKNALSVYEDREADPVGLEARDIRLVAQRQGNFIPAVEEALAEEWVDGKASLESARRNTLGGQVDGNLHSRLLHRKRDQLAYGWLGQLGREEPAAEAVALEDVAERRGDDDPEPRIEQ